MRTVRAVLLLAMTLALASCATTKDKRAWQPGDSIICPHCGRGFAVPEKLGP